MLHVSGNEILSGLDHDLLTVGKLASPYGVRGWMHVVSYTDPIINIFSYTPWFIGAEEHWQQYELEQSRPHGKGLVVKLPSCTDRDQAARLTGALIAVKKALLPPPENDEFYWFDLVGLEVVTQQGHILGIVDTILETGANDVLVIKGEREYLIPYVKKEFIKEVNLNKRVIIVDWDLDF